MPSGRSQHRNQHTVQRSYLKRFANSQGKLWQYDKQTRLITDVAASRATAQSDFYTLRLQNEEESLFWETELLGRNVETPAARSIEKILNSPDDPITEQDREYVALWIAMSALRTTQIRDVIASGVSQLLEHRFRDPAAPAALRGHSAEILSRNPHIIKNFHIRTMHSMFEGMTRDIYRRGWGTVRFEDRQLLTSDNPVANYHEVFTGQPRGDDEPLFVVPLSPQVGLLISGRHFEDYTIPASKDTANWFNNKVINSSHRYVYYNADDDRQRYFAELTPAERRARFQE